MFCTADVSIDGKQLIDGSTVEGRAVVVRVRIAQIVPARAHEGIEGIGIAHRLAAALGADGVHELLVLGKGRLPVGAELDVIGEPHGKIFFGHGHVAADGAVHNGDGRAPIALTGDEPVS